MGCKRVIFSGTNQPTTPANNGYTFIWDTTNWQSSVKGTLGRSGSVSTVGPDRCWGEGKTVEVTVAPVTQAVTFYLALLSGAGAWVNVPIDGSTGTTVAAGTLKPFVLTPGAPDFLIYCLAGATAPASIGVTIAILEE
jgi:hypothetical protein